MENTRLFSLPETTPEWKSKERFEMGNHTGCLEDTTSKGGFYLPAYSSMEYSVCSLQNTVISRNKKKGTLFILVREETEVSSVRQAEWSGEENSFYSGKQSDLRFKTEWLTFEKGEERRRKFFKDKEMRETKGKRGYFFGQYLTIEPTTQEC
ncbi:hypothetical protein B1750_gp377 [Noumeavirus]|uniref:hypothetical protein n=1 Tax=Noumeavirus TaxID=1955558 RepID=UPI000982F2C1|nr:hypothetical protein B1750_gp377 [Noumeavirus]AQM73358.1 hypothetical protein NMV_377 [Noumeavirus]